MPIGGGRTRVRSITARSIASAAVSAVDRYREAQFHVAVVVDQNALKHRVQEVLAFLTREIIQPLTGIFKPSLK